MRMIARSLMSLAFIAVSGCAFGDPLVWDVTGQNLFGKLNLSTGEFTQVSNVGFIAAGLAGLGNHVYTAASGGVGLYSIDTVSGNTSLIGNSSISYYTFGSTKTGLYMVDTVGGLWNIDPSNGTSTLIGSTHLDIQAGLSIGLSSGSNTLYLALGSSIYTINTSTGAASYVGTSGTTDFGALVDVSGTVYGSSIIAPNAIYSFNPVTGTATYLAASNAGTYAFGMAPIVPEPSSFALLGLGSILAAGFSFRRKLKAAL